MSQRQMPLGVRAAAMLAATAGALGPVVESLARRRKKRRNDEDDDDDDDKLQLLRRRRRRRQEENDDDDDEKVGAALRAKKRKAADDDDEDDGDDDTGATISRKQSIVGDLGIQDIVQERIDTIIGGGGGGGGDDANIVVSEDGDTLLVLTNDIDFAADSEGFEVETGGISYSSGAGGGLLEDDFSS